MAKRAWWVFIIDLTWLAVFGVALLPEQSGLFVLVIAFGGYNYVDGRTRTNA